MLAVTSNNGKLIIQLEWPNLTLEYTPIPSSTTDNEARQS